MASNRERELLDRVRTLAVDLSSAMDVDVLDVELRGQGPRTVVRVVADTADLDPAAALDVDTIADLSRRLSAALDEQDAVPGSYTLEVTSPGADRALHTARDFARNVGRAVQVHHRTADGEHDTTGELVAVDDEGITLRTDAETTTLSLEDVDHGRVVLPW
jgi:ribosome maturation factor RimP